MQIVWLIFALVVAFLVSLCAAQIAKEKGRSFWAFLILSFLFSPVIGLLIATYGKKKNETQDASH
jgi:phosphotransferase system  glucose/maltose/N-acetylglucosamine-specific IIC component